MSRTPEKTPRYRVVQENLQAFLAEAEESGRAVPLFVERGPRAFLDCGILSRIRELRLLPCECVAGLAATIDWWRFVTDEDLSLVHESPHLVPHIPCPAL